MHLNLLEQLKTSNIGKQLEADFQSETLAKRQAAAAEIKRITAELVKALPALLQAREKAEGDVKGALESLQEARQAFDRAHGVVHNLTVRADARRHNEEQILRSTYPPEIDAFEDAMRDLLTSTRSKGIESRDHGERNILNDSWKPEVFSDSKSVHARLKYLQSAIAEAEDLKLKPLPVKEVLERLQEMKRQIPVTGKLEFVQ